MEECGIDTTSSHGPPSKTIEHHAAHLPALLGWSQGALVAQLVAQKSPHLLSKLVLYGSIYDPLVRHPRRPLYLNVTDSTIENDGEQLVASPQ